MGPKVPWALGSIRMDKLALVYDCLPSELQLFEDGETFSVLLIDISPQVKQELHIAMFNKYLLNIWMAKKYHLGFPLELVFYSLSESLVCVV